MKKIFKYKNIYIVALVILCLVACNSNVNKTVDTANETVDATQQEQSDNIDGNGEDSNEEEFMMSQENVNILYGNMTNLDVYGAKGKVTWESSNPIAVEIEKDDENDTYVMVKALKAGEESIIKARTDSQGEVSCRVKVLSRGLYLQDDRGNNGDASSGTYNLGSEHKYKVFFDGDEIDANDVVWNSLNEDVAKVSNGVVSMVGTGVTYITAADKSENIAHAGVWISDTADEYETKIPDKGLFFNYMFLSYEIHMLSGIDGESEGFSLSEVYDDGEQIDAGKLMWSVENLKGTPFNIDDAETNAENVSIIYTGTEGEAYLVATNPETGHSFKYLIQVINPEK